MLEKERITSAESIALSIIRVFAMALIVSCHLAQCYGLMIAWVLNVGVQVFFFMSGFLYGRLDTSASPWNFYKKRLVKVYLPFLIWVAIIVVVYSAFHLYHFNAKQIVLYLLNLQWFSTPIEGLNHLWFLTVLMVGYLLTPWAKKLLKKYPFLCISVFMMGCIIEFVFVKKFYSIFAWIALYFAGFFYGSFYSKKLSNVMLLIGAVALIVLGLFFKQDWLTDVEYSHYSIWLHWILGLFLFVLLYRIFPLLIDSNKKYAAIMHLDKISYEVYLTHHPLILGPLSMMFLTQYDVVNIMIMLLTVYILSRILHYVGSFALKLL